MAVSLKSYALWNLTSVKRYLDNTADTTQDDRLRGIVNAVTDRFELFTQRHLGWRDFTSTGEKYTGDNTRELYLRGWPIRSVSSVAIEDESAIDTTDSTVIRFHLNSEDQNRLVLVGGRLWSRGYYDFEGITVKYSCGYTPVTDALTANSLPEDLHLAGHTEIARRFYERDRHKEGIESQSFEGSSTVFSKPGSLLTETRDVLSAYQGWPVLR